MHSLLGIIVLILCFNAVHTFYPCHCSFICIICFMLQLEVLFLSCCYNIVFLLVAHVFRRLFVCFYVFAAYDVLIILYCLRVLVCCPFALAYLRRGCSGSCCWHTVLGRSGSYFGGLRSILGLFWSFGTHFGTPRTHFGSSGGRFRVLGVHFGVLGGGFGGFSLSGEIAIERRGRDHA